MNLNTRIEKIIEYSKLSASEFADEIEVQRSSISHITSGRNKPSLEFVIKIKSRFPEIQWDWLINGLGEMLASEISDTKTEENTSPSPLPLPDLFTLIDDETFGHTESEDKMMSSKNNWRESSVLISDEGKNKISDSQPIETLPKKETISATEKKHQIKKIVFFYENGTFESFEP